MLKILGEVRVSITEETLENWQLYGCVHLPDRRKLDRESKKLGPGQDRGKKWTAKQDACAIRDSIRDVEAGIYRVNGKALRTVSKAAELAGVSRNTLAKKVKAGAIPSTLAKNKRGAGLVLRKVVDPEKVKLDDGSTFDGFFGGDPNDPNCPVAVKTTAVKLIPMKYGQLRSELKRRGIKPERKQPPGQRKKVDTVPMSLVSDLQREVDAKLKRLKKRKGSNRRSSSELAEDRGLTKNIPKFNMLLAELRRCNPDIAHQELERLVDKPGKPLVPVWKYEPQAVEDFIGGGGHRDRMARVAGITHYRA